MIINAQAQVQVHEEPRHTAIFKNKELRLLDVRVPPGDTTQYHVHHTPSLFIYFTNSAVGSQLQGQPPSAGKNTAGGMIFENLAPPNTRTHRVWNADTASFHVIDLEILSNDTGFRTRPLLSPLLSLEIDTAWVRAYRLTLAKGKEFIMPKSDHAFMLVSFDDSMVQTKLSSKTEQQTLGPGGFIYIQKGESFSIKTLHENPAHFALLQLPAH